MKRSPHKVVVTFLIICLVAAMLYAYSISASVVNASHRKEILVFSGEELSLVRQKIAQIKKGQWHTSRHKSYPTTDIPVSKLWEIDILLCDKLERILIPEFSRLYKVREDCLWLRDLFLVKYESGQQTGLELHRDASDFSFVIQVNSLEEFNGGGTFFEDDKRVYNMKPGNCLLFSGKELHSGVNITSGKRIIITGFVDYHEHECKLRRQHLLFNLLSMTKRKKFGFHHFHK